jgi:hypothetical protein
MYLSLHKEGLIDVWNYSYTISMTILLVLASAVSMPAMTDYWTSQTR